MPVATQRGGAEVQLQQLIEHRREARLEPTVAFMQRGPMLEWCREQGVGVAALDAGRLREPLKLGRAVRALVSLATACGAQAVIGWMAKGQVYGGLAAAAARIPTVWLQPGVGPGFIAIDRAATLLPTRLVITNSRGTDLAQRTLRPRRPTTVIYPGVDTARFDPRRIGDKREVRRRLGLPLEAPIFGSVGRLNSWKGFHVLLAAVPAVVAHNPSATLVLVGGRHEGEPAYADHLTSQARLLGYDGQVLLVGQQTNPEEWMQAMDVFVHTSRREPFGMVVIEAMSLGKAVIAAAEGGPTEIITPGVDGILSPYGDARTLAAAIVSLFDDDDLRSRMGDAARRRAEDFAVGRFARQLGSAIAAVAGGEPSVGARSTTDASRWRAAGSATSQ